MGPLSFETLRLWPLRQLRWRSKARTPTLIISRSTARALPAIVIVTSASIVIASTITAATTTTLTATSLRSSLDDRIEISAADQFENFA
jgi:hypothetical protein